MPINADEAQGFTAKDAEGAKEEESLTSENAEGATGNLSVQTPRLLRGSQRAAYRGATG